MTTTTKHTRSHNGHFPATTARDAATTYLAKKLVPVPVLFRSKQCVQDGWPDLRVTTEDIPRLFAGRHNVAILNGAPSGNLADVDLDCVQAIRAAALLLPTTGWIFGRKSARRSHWYYRTDAPLSACSQGYTDVDGKMLLELRGTGSQTLVPPSLHPDNERVEWHTFAEEGPAHVELAKLQVAVAEIAAVTLLARHWPGEGGRNGARLALAGGLLRGGWEVERAERFMEALAEAVRAVKSEDYTGAVAATAKRLDADKNTTGWPKLAEELGEYSDAVVAKVREWLHIVHKKASIRTLEPYQPFPVEALPALLRVFAIEGAAALNCDPVFLALPALTIIASTIGNTRTIRLKRGWHEPAVVWGGIVGDSGALKTPAWKAAVGYLFQVQKKHSDDYRDCCVPGKSWLRPTKREPIRLTNPYSNVWCVRTPPSRSWLRFLPTTPVVCCWHEMNWQVG
jgi:hypothetical protein